MMPLGIVVRLGHVGRVMCLLCVFSVCLTRVSPACAQGNLTPVAAPSATMKSLQEIWDRVDSHEAEIGRIQEQNRSLLEVSSQNSIRLRSILSTLDVDLPWQTTSLESVDRVGGTHHWRLAPMGIPRFHITPIRISPPPRTTTLNSRGLTGSVGIG